MKELRHWPVAEGKWLLGEGAKLHCFFFFIFW